MANFMTLTRFDSMSRMHFPITVDADSIESFSAVEPGRWNAYYAEVTLKSGQTFLARETHADILEKLKLQGEDEDNEHEPDTG